MAELNGKIENCPFMNQIRATYSTYKISPTGGVRQDCDNAKKMIFLIINISVFVQIHWSLFVSVRNQWILKNSVVNDLINNSPK